jgi:prevent-host-death family protein
MMDDEVGMYEARTRFAELLTEVEKGRRVVITRHGKPVAMLSPILQPDPVRTQAVIDKLRATRRGRRLGGEIRECRR